MTSPLAKRASQNDDHHVVAVVLLRGEDRYLEQSLRSLEAQRRKPDEVILVQEVSGGIPDWICDDFPEVCVLRTDDATRRGALLNALVELAPGDAYLLQDASDWSDRFRLQHLLTVAMRTGAELLGSAYVWIAPDVPDAETVTMPLDGNEAFQVGPTRGVVEPSTMLFFGSLFERLGGFSSGLSVAALDEFVTRGAVAGTVANASHALYFRRKEAGGAWSGPAERESLLARVAYAALDERSRHHVSLLTRSERPDVTNRGHRLVAELEHVRGPYPGVRGHQAARAPRPSRNRSQQGASTAHDPAPAPPVFVVSGLEPLARFLAFCIGQHSSFVPFAATAWMTEVAATAARYLQGLQAREASGRLTGSSAEAVYMAASASVDALLLATSMGQPDEMGRRWVSAPRAERRTLMAAAALYPKARLIHVVRPVDADVYASFRIGGDAEASELYDSWLNATRAILATRQLLDEEQVLVVQFDDFARDPVRAMSACLEFLGEEYEPECIGFLVGRDTKAGPKRGVLVPELDALPAQFDARLLSLALTGKRASSKRGPTLAELTSALGGASTSPLPSNLGAESRTAERDPNPYSSSHDLVHRVAARDAVVSVVSKGDERAVRFPGRAVGWHFPQTEDGTYLGHHPRDGREAITHLEHLRRLGAEFLLIPKPYMWWLAHYTDFRLHLEHLYVRAPSNDEEGALFDLRAGKAPLAGGERPSAEAR